ncbi:MAG: hypothetical protein R3F46_07270 [bacterium]
MILKPLSSAARGAGQGPPGWLGIQPGEQLLLRWGRGCGCKDLQQRSTTVMVSAAAGISTLITTQAGSTPSSARSVWEWLAIGLGLTMLLATMIYAVVRKFGALQAVLTDRRMVFREKRQLSEIRLADISRLETVQLRRQQAVRIHVGRQAGPAVTLPLDDPAELEQIRMAALAAGAKLR